MFVVKDNVPTLKTSIELYIQNEQVENYTTMEKNGGRIEKRTAYSTSDTGWLKDHRIRKFNHHRRNPPGI